jgi:signal transduction histidine kinase
MKLSFSGKIRFMVILMFVLALVQGLVILQLIGNDDIELIKSDIQNTIYITLFLQFVILLIMIFYIPVFLHKSFSEIHNVLKEISNGIYNIETNTDRESTGLDKEIFAVMLSIKSMLRSIRKFDDLKKDKIVEHHNRIVSLLNLTDDGFMILDIKGNIIYINDIVTEAFPAIGEKKNMIDSNFPPEIENHIKKYVMNILKTKTKSEQTGFFFPKLKRHIGLNSAIIRDSAGTAQGIIISFKNFEKKKSEKTEQQPEIKM